jgi:hypothetical protein
MNKTIIAGGRGFDDYEFLKESVDALEIDITEVVSGKCKGVDLFGEQYAKENEIKIKEFPANWKQFGRSAGPIRNGEMAKYADTLIAFWDQKSKGTKSMINLAKKNGLTVHVINY